MDHRDLDDPPAPRFRGVSEAVTYPDFGPGDLLVSDGLPSERLRHVAHEICGDPVEANRLIHAIVPKSSLNRRGKLTLIQGEQTERLHRLFAQSYAVFQDIGDAREFMRRPHPQLDARRPIDAAMTEMGGRAVERILDSLLYGLPA